MAKALWAQTVGDGYRYGGEAGLRAMRKAGSNINSFNVEQQGDILSDYYRRLVSGQDVTAWEPYAEDVKKL